MYKSMDIDFLKGATLGDQLTVRTSVLDMGKTSVLFLQELVDDDRDDESEVLYCSAKVRVVCIDTEKKKPVMIPSSIKIGVKNK